MMSCCTSAIHCIRTWLAWGHHAGDVPSLGAAATGTSCSLAAAWPMACPSRQTLCTGSTPGTVDMQPCTRCSVHRRARCAPSVVWGSGRTTGHLAATPPVHCRRRMGQRGAAITRCRSTAARRMPGMVRPRATRRSRCRPSVRGAPMCRRAPPRCVRMRCRSFVPHRPTAWARSRRSNTRRSCLTLTAGGGGPTTTPTAPARRTRRRPTTVRLSVE